MKRCRHLLKTLNGDFAADSVSLLFCIHGLWTLMDHFHLHCLLSRRCSEHLQKTDGHRLVIHTCLKSLSLAKEFKNRYLRYFLAAYQNKELIFPGNTAEFEPRQRFALLLKSLSKAKWIAYAKHPFGGPEQVISVSWPLHTPGSHLKQSNTVYFSTERSPLLTGTGKIMMKSKQ